MHWFSRCFYRETEGKFEPSGKRIKRLPAIERKLFRRTAGHAFCDHKRNEDILEELKVEQVDEKLRRCKSN
jgi:acetone carboxylase gamma subunit